MPEAIREKAGKPTSKNSKMTVLSKVRPDTNIIVFSAFILLCYWLLVGKNGYMLQWYDEMSYFDSSSIFLRHSLHYPGGLLGYAGAWLTQLMYYPLLGCTVLIALWLLLSWLTVKAFRLSRTAAPLALLAPMCMLVSVVQLDEAWLSMNSAGYLYSNTLGYMFTVSSVFLYRLSRKHTAAGVLVPLLTAACYFIAGFYALLGALLGSILMIAGSIRMKRYAGALSSVLVIAVIIALPYFYYSYFNGTTVDNDHLHLKGLPDFLMESFDIYLWKPFIVATVCLTALSILSVLRLQDSSRIMKWTSVSAVCIMAIWSINAEQKNQQLRATVMMLRHLENNDWNAITEVMSGTTEAPNMTMRILNNVAVINLGGRGANLDGMQPVNTDSRHAEWFTMTAFVNVPVNYYEGLFNESYQWAMEHSVQYGKRVFFLKYMVKDELLNGNIALARRYNDLLLGTMFHRKWAEGMRPYIEDPALIETNPEFRSILEISKTHRPED